MKFAERYEIQEMVTSGRVSTFLARDRNSQEPVVVYTFEVTGTTAADLSTASIISRFSSLAPSPPGIIVKAGFDQASSSAFLTTKMPEPAALQQWVATYHSFGKTTPPPPAQKTASAAPSDETAELSAADLRAYLAQSSAQKAAQRTTSAPPTPAKNESSGSITDIFGIDTPATAAQSQSSGEFTRLFRELNAFEPVRSTKPPVAPKPTTSATDANFGQRLGGSPLGQPEPAATPPPPVPAGPESPGAFTREFLGLPSTPAEPPAASTAVEKPAVKEPGAFTREFLAGSSPSPDSATVKVPHTPPASAGPPSIFGSAFGSEPSKPASPPSFEGQPPKKESTGEFTRYFQDPFEHPGTQQNVPVVPELANVEPPKQHAGDFTRMFGKIGTEPEPLPVTEPAPEGTGVGSFTEVFEKGAPGQGSRLGTSTLGTNPNFQQKFPEPVKTPPPAPPRTAVPVAPPPSPASPTPALDELLATHSARVPESNATFMNRPASSTTNVFSPGIDAPPVEDLPKGPSEFTMFLNRSQVNAVMRPTPGAAPPPTGGQVVAPPPISNPFMAPPIPPPPPVMAAPPMPAAPQIPRPPVPPAVAAPKANTLWPLITGLTILFAIGVILVMYFVLKH